MPEKLHSLQPDKWIKLYADYLFEYANSRISNYEASRDIVQDTFLSALNSRDGFKGNASEKTWLTAILKRKIIDHYRKINSKKIKSEVLLDFDEKGHWILDQAPGKWEHTTDAEIENTELKKIIDLCISLLPENHALVFRMRSIQHMLSEDICKELDISSSNYWVIIHRARLQLRKCLEENWFNN